MSILSTQPPRIHSSNPTTPVRLVEGGGTDYERRLLDAAHRDLPPAASSEKVFAALRAAGVSGNSPEPTASEQGPAQRASDAASLVNPWTLGVLGAGIIGVLIASAWSSASEVAEVIAAPVVAPAPGVLDNAALLSEADVAGDPLPDEGDMSPTAERREPAVRQRAKAPVTSPPAAPKKLPEPEQSIDLAAEVRAIESIQTLLGWGDSGHARGALSDYRRRFPRGELTLEADLLNVDIAIASGDRAEASRLARALLKRPAANRYRERLNALLEASHHPAASSPEPNRARNAGDRSGSNRAPR